MKTLVVYYSQSGNAQWMAERISSALSADMLRLTPRKAYQEKEFGKHFFGGDVPTLWLVEPKQKLSAEP